jgi:hypothetical protein
MPFFTIFFGRSTLWACLESRNAPSSLVGSGGKVAPEPIGGEFRHLFERAGFFKEVAGSRNDRELFAGLSFQAFRTADGWRASSDR